MLPSFIEALRRRVFVVSAWAPGVKRVQGTEGVWEITFAPDGRATFAYGAEVRSGEVHVIWRRVGTHEVLSDP